MSGFRLNHSNAWVLLCAGLCLPVAVRAALPYAVFPAEGSTVPADAPIRLTFPSAPRAGSAGALRVKSSDGRVAYTLAIGRAASGTIPGTVRAKIGADSLNVHPVILDGQEAYLFLPAGALAFGAAYTAEIDAGAFAAADGKSYPAASWTFKTAALPASGRDVYTVAADGGGDFCTVQGALDFLSQGTTPVTVAIGPGTYREILRSAGRDGITLAGAGREACVIRAANNEKQNAGISARPSARIFGDDWTLRDLTFVNDTPQDGSQAEALFYRGQRCVIRKCLFRSFQDTMLLEGRAYLADCRIEGAVDYVWGRGIAYFRDCTLHSNADGYIVQARNAKGQRGYVFVGCTLSAAAGARSSYLARDGNGEYPDGDVRYIDCAMGTHVPREGWLLRTVAGATPSFAEYGSKDSQGKALDLSGRSAFSRVMTASEAEGLRHAVSVLGGSDGWDPEKTTGLAPRRAPSAPGKPFRRALRDANGRRSDAEARRRQVSQARF